MTRPTSAGRMSARRRIVGQTSAAAHADMSKTATVRLDNNGARTRSAIKPRRAGTAHAPLTTEAVRSRRRSRAFRSASQKASTNATKPTPKAPSTDRHTGQGPGKGGMADVRAALANARARECVPGRPPRALPRRLTYERLVSSLSPTKANSAPSVRRPTRLGERGQGRRSRRRYNRVLPGVPGESPDVSFVVDHENTRDGRSMADRRPRPRVVSAFFPRSWGVADMT